MSVLNPEQLQRRYAELDDGALITLLQNNGLIQSAQEIAMRELTSRGITLGQTQAEAGTEIELARDEETDFNDESMDSLTEVARFNAPVEGHMLEARLHAEGIPAWATDTNTIQALSHLTVALGGVRVMVPSHLLMDAREVMRRLEAGEFALDDDYEELS